MNHFARLARAALLVSFVAASVLALAEKHALLIGIDEYQDSDRISSLGGAAADAKGLAKALEEVGKFSDVRVVTSEDGSKPTRSNILFEVEQLSKRVKPGDMVLFAFSGHGIELNQTTYLIPYDGDLRTELTLQASSIPASTLLALFAKMPAGVLIDCFDMCRNDPHKGSKGDTPNLLNDKQARELVLVPSSDQAGQSGPESVVTLFACQSGQRSWEWPGKKRGIFSLCLENALRTGAVDDQGEVRLQKLLGLLGSTVQDVAKKELNEAQRPRVEISAPAGFDVALAEGLPKAVSTEPTTSTNTNSLYDAALKRGHELVEAKRFDAAEEKFAEAYGIKPTAYAEFWQGRCAVLAKNYEHATELLNKAKELDPTYGPIYSNFAWISFNQGDYKAAEGNFKKATDLGPSSTTWMNLAKCEVKLKSFDAADEAFKKALEADPKSSSNTNQYALFLLDHRSNPLAAEEYLKKAAELDPKNPFPVANLGALREDNDHNNEAAITLYESAVAIDPKCAYALGRLGHLKLAKDKAEGIKLLKQAVAIDAHEDTAWNYLGNAYWDDKNYAEAESSYRKASEADPEDGLYHANIACAMLRLNRKGEAIVEARKALDLGFKDHWIFKELGLGG